MRTERGLRPIVRLAAFATVAMFAWPRAASGQLRSRALESLPDGAARDAIRATVAAADSRGVPTAPLFTKVQEGVAKQAAPSRIADAVRLLATRLTTATEALAVALSADEVAAGAEALQVGVPAPTLRELRKRWATTPLTVPLGVMTQMVASGVPVSRASSQVRLLLERGATPTQLVALTNSVQADVASGMAPDVAFTLRSSGLLSGADGLTTTSVAPPSNRAPPRP